MVDKDKSSISNAAPPAATTPGATATGAGTPGGNSSTEEMKREAQAKADQAKMQADQTAQQAKDKANQTAEQAKAKANETAEQVKGQANQAAHQLKGQAAQAAEQMKEQGRRMFEDQRSNAVTHMDKIASALHDTADNMRQQQEVSAGNMIDQAASGLERLAEKLRTQDVESMYVQASSTMRRNPALFIGGAVLAGFALSRFLKSSSEHEQGGMGHARGASGVPTSQASSTGSSYVTSAHADPDQVAGQVTGGRAAVPPEMPTGRRNY